MRLDRPGRRAGRCAWSRLADQIDVHLGLVDVVLDQVVDEGRRCQQVGEDGAVVHQGHHSGEVVAVHHGAGHHPDDVAGRRRRSD